MEIITSSQNKYVALAKSLKMKKFRDETGLFVVEGGNVIKDMNYDAKIRFILATEDRAEEVQKLLEYTRAQVYYISEGVMNSVSDTVTPYGIIAVAEKDERAFKLPEGNALLLDGVSDPGNLGTVIRTAAAAGFDDVYLLDCADVFSPKVVRATLGGLFKVRVYNVSFENAIDLISNTVSVALDMDGKSITDGGLKAPVTLIAGSEAHGIRTEISAAAREVRSLPMQNGIESLNVAVATAVAMYQTKGE